MLTQAVPLWAIFILTAVLLFLAYEGGHRLGALRRQRSTGATDSAVGTIAGATLGLLSFLLAFTFGLAASQQDARRDLLIDEANAIETAYLIAAMVPEPEQSEVRRLLREYVNIRLEGIRLERVDQAIRRSGDLHRQLWTQAISVSAENVTPVVTGQFIQSLNRVTDLHSRRLFTTGIPGVIWTVLYILAILAMAGVGYRYGASGDLRSITVVALVLSYSSVLYLIADLDRPEEGLLKVSGQVIADLRDAMNAGSSVPR